MLVAQLCPTLCNPMDCSLCPRDFPGKNTGVDCHSLLQEIFPTQELNLGLPHFFSSSLTISFKCVSFLYYCCHLSPHTQNTEVSP